MVNLRLTKMQVQEICLWGQWYQDHMKELRVPFESDEIELLVKLRASIGRSPDGLEPLNSLPSLKAGVSLEAT